MLSRSVVTRLITEWQPSELTETLPIFHRTSIISNVRFRKAAVIEQTHEEATNCLKGMGKVFVANIS